MWAFSRGSRWVVLRFRLFGGWSLLGRILFSGRCGKIRRFNAVRSSGIGGRHGPLYRRCDLSHRFKWARRASAHFLFYSHLVVCGLGPFLALHGLSLEFPGAFEGGVQLAEESESFLGGQGQGHLHVSVPREPSLPVRPIDVPALVRRSGGQPRDVRSVSVHQKGIVVLEV